MIEVRCDGQNLVAHGVRAAASLALLLACAVGCRSMSGSSAFSPGPPAPQVLAPTSTVDQIIAAVNQNTSRIHSYVTNNASISLLGMPNLPLVQGNIAYERPQRFRFQARSLTGPEVDFGSNEERFWLWARRMEDQQGQAPLYTVRHDQYATSGAQRMMPIEPQWIIEALGMVTIDPATAQPPMPRSDGKIEIRTFLYSPRGQLTRVLVIDTHGWVTEQSIVNPQGQLLASATGERFRYDPATQVSLPEVVTVRVPGAELALRIDTGKVSINTPTGDPTRLWRPPVMQNHPVVDLGQGAPIAQPSVLPQPINQTLWQAMGPQPIGTEPIGTQPIGPTVDQPPITPLPAMASPASVPVSHGPEASAAEVASPPPTPVMYQLPQGGIELPPL